MSRLPYLNIDNGNDLEYSSRCDHAMTLSHPTDHSDGPNDYG